MHIKENLKASFDQFDSYSFTSFFLSASPISKMWYLGNVCFAFSPRPRLDHVVWKLNSLFICLLESTSFCLMLDMALTGFTLVLRTNSNHLTISFGDTNSRLYWNVTLLFRDIKYVRRTLMEWRCSIVNIMPTTDWGCVSFAWW